MGKTKRKLPDLSEPVAKVRERAGKTDVHSKKKKSNPRGATIGKNTKLRPLQIAAAKDMVARYISEGFTLSQAVERAGYHNTQVARWRKTDPAFDKVIRKLVNASEAAAVPEGSTKEYEQDKKEAILEGLRMGLHLDEAVAHAGLMMSDYINITMELPEFIKMAAKAKADNIYWWIEKMRECVDRKGDWRACIAYLERFAPESWAGIAKLKVDASMLLRNKSTGATMPMQQLGPGQEAQPVKITAFEDMTDEELRKRLSEADSDLFG